MPRYSARRIENALSGYVEARKSNEAWDAYVRSLGHGPVADIVVAKATYRLRDSRGTYSIPSYSSDFEVVAAFALDDTDYLSISIDREKYTIDVDVECGEYRGAATHNWRDCKDRADADAERAFAVCLALLAMYSPTSEELGEEDQAPMSWQNVTLRVTELAPLPLYSVADMEAWMRSEIDGFGMRNPKEGAMP